MHRLAARVARVRAAEYGLPVLRLCSSGILQLVRGDGSLAAWAPSPGQGEALSGALPLSGPGRVPPDALLSPLCMVVTGLAVLWLSPPARFRRRRASCAER